MSWNTLPQATRDRAEAQLTQRQLNVLTLHLAGCSQRRIATMLNLKRTTVRDHLRTALDTISQEPT